MPKKDKRDAKPDPGFGTRLRNRIRRHHTPIFAAAIAFFGFVALIPALVAVVSITSLVADPDDLISETEAALEAAPKETSDFLVAQIRSIAEADGSGVGIAAAAAIALSVFSASGAIAHLMSSLNVVFDRDENRNFAAKRLMAIGLLLGAIVLLGAMVFTMAVLPEYLGGWVENDAVRTVIHIGRFAGLGALMAAGLSALYRIGPAPREAGTYELVPGGRRELITLGALIGTVLFVLLSWGFGVFAGNFGSYNETYGALAGIIVVLLWLQLAALAVLIGAEVDALRQKIRIERSRVEAGLPPQPSG